jgi:hypothetical protein
MKVQWQVSTQSPHHPPHTPPAHITGADRNINSPRRKVGSRQRLLLCGSFAAQYVIKGAAQTVTGLPFQGVTLNVRT